MFPIPTSIFLTQGVGVHRHRLTAFEFALREADIEQQNLVSVSSIFPPRCQLVAREEGVATLRPGEVTFCVLARAETNEPGRLVHASIGLARPADPGRSPPGDIRRSGRRLGFACHRRGPGKGDSPR